MTIILFFLGFLVSCFLIFVIYYLSTAKILKILPSNAKSIVPTSGIEMLVISNGAHSDICLPIKSEVIDWTEFVDTDYFQMGDYQYISFGWGDKGFYLDTPTWAELKPSTAFKACFRLGQTAVQVVLYEGIPQTKWVKSLIITPEQYQNIIPYIRSSFQCNEQGKIIPIEFAGLPAYNHLNYKFFEGQGAYHFFKTCNCWVNNILKIADIKTATWAPFAKSVFHHLE